MDVYIFRNVDDNECEYIDRTRHLTNNRVLQSLDINFDRLDIISPLASQSPWHCDTAFSQYQKRATGLLESIFAARASELLLIVVSISRAS